jgi:hypothetical protein
MFEDLDLSAIQVMAEDHENNLDVVSVIEEVQNLDLSAIEVVQNFDISAIEVVVPSLLEGSPDHQHHDDINEISFKRKEASVLLNIESVQEDDEEESFSQEEDQISRDIHCMRKDVPVQEDDEEESFSQEEDQISRDWLLKQEESVHIELGKRLIEVIRDMKPKERRHLMAIGSQHVTKNAFDMLLGRTVSAREWSQINKHAKFPGPGIPYQLKQNHFRMRVLDETITDFLQWLFASNSIQHLACGQKVLQLSSGKFICIEAVDRTKKTNDIVREYFRSFLQERGEENIEYCDAMSKKTNTHCLLEKGHNGKHRYTPTNGKMLSPSLVEKIITELTHGEMKSLAGLDNTYVECGRENFENMVAWVEMLKSFNAIGNACIPDDEFTHLIRKIKAAELFHQAGYAQHLGKSDHSCACFECGFYYDGHDVTCAKYMQKKHIGPCGDCFESFQILDYMHKLHSRVHVELETKTFFVGSPAVEDDMNIMLDELNEFFRLLLKYREHVAQREDEDIYDSEFFSTLKEDEVVVVLDYKMKILAAYFREKQVDWFSKRGFSCLGVLLYFGSSSDEDVNQVEYHFFLSADTSQDCDAVNIVKDIVYNVILPVYGVKRVHFRTDGAKNFVGNKVKSIIAHWGIEKSFKTTVPGCGKTSLDGMFGIITQFLAKANNAGKTYKNAEELWDILDSSGLNFSYFHLYKPERSQMSHFQYNQMDAKKIESLHLGKDFYLMTCEDGEVHAKYHSRHGSGIRLKLLDNKLDQLDQELKSSHQNAYAKELIDTHLLKSILLTHPQSLHNNRRSLHQKKKWRERKTEKRQELIDDRNHRLDKKWEEKAADLKKIGLYMCDEQNHVTGECCSKLFVSKNNLDKHKQRGEHTFPKESLLTSAINDARSGKYSLCLDTGTRINRDRSVASDYVPKEGPGVSFEFEHVSKEKSFGRGCYHKKNRSTIKKQFKASPALLHQLENLFMQGQDKADKSVKIKSSKYTAEEALAELRNRKTEDGRRFYGPGCEGGPLPTQSYVKSWFSNRASEKAFKFSNELVRCLEEIVDQTENLSARQICNKLKLIKTADGESLFGPECIGGELPKEKHIKMWISQREENDCEYY